MIESEKYGIFGEKPLLNINIPSVPVIVQRPAKSNKLNKILPKIKEWADIMFKK